LKRDYAAKKPVAVVLWSPHWAYSTYRLTKLTDPKGLWGPGDAIHTLANTPSAGRLPEVTAWMRNFHLTDAQLGSLEASIQSAGQGRTAEGVKSWLAANPGVEKAMTPPGHPAANG
jgi:glycine betaine/proline transport system substrate-binding protein